MRGKILKGIVFVLIICLILSIPYIANAAQYYQTVRSGIAAFPESYQTKLKELSAKYPNWKFQAYYTGIPWDELLEKERGDDSIRRNRVSANSELTWKHQCEDPIEATEDYLCASDAIVAYYLDPRNFLNEQNIFQFVETSYNEQQQTASAIEQSVKGTFLDNTITCKDFNGNDVTMSYSQIIVEAAKESNVSAYYIKSKIIQEVGVNGSGSVTGTYPGHEGYYNFFNYGAYDTGDPIANGLVYAQQQGWDSQYKAIVGGAKLIGKQYIDAGQNTPYFNKWDVVGTKILQDGQSQTVQESDMFAHQYMTNIQDPTNQSYSYYDLYSQNLNSDITFIIPVYDDMPASNPMPHDIKLNSISLQTTELNLQVGAEATVTTGWIGANYNPSNVTDKVLYWSSSNENVATVSEGNVKAVGEGTATITATSRDGSKTATCKVNVTRVDKALKSITMKQSNITLEEGKTGWIGVNYNPSDASDKVLYWTSSNTDVATVSEGNIKAIREGTATLTATSRDGGRTATCKVTVTSPIVHVQSISLKTTSLTMRPGDKTTVYAVYNPSNVTDKVLTWTSSNTNVATVSEGNVTAVGVGTATITAKSRDGGKTATCKVTVSDGTVKLESISLKTTSLSMKKGDKTTVYAVYNPSNVTDKVLTWTSSNTDVATVSEGNVTAVGAGTATITAKSRDGGKTASCTVTVTDGTIKVQSISLKSTTEILTKGSTKTIYAVYNPSNVTDKVLTWSSSNTGVATVSEGVVKAVGTGVATITAKSRDGGKTASCTVVVTDKNSQMKEITLKTTEETMEKGENTTIYAVYNPSNVNDKVLYWITSNPKVATVSEGVVKAVGKGTATITAISKDGGKTATCKITVTD